MAITLYDSTVALFVQGLGGLEAVLKKGLEHFSAAGVDANAILDVRLAADMLPMRYQIYATTGHSLGAVEACGTGVFKPPATVPALDYAGYQQLVADAKAKLAAMSSADINALEGRDVVFQLGDRALPFVAEGFLMTFSLPNFFFHATTAYDILRHKGVPLAKQDFMGRVKIKR
jgi:hypothetical protein